MRRHIRAALAVSLLVAAIGYSSIDLISYQAQIRMAALVLAVVSLPFLTFTRATVPFIGYLGWATWSGFSSQGGWGTHHVWLVGSFMLYHLAAGLSERQQRYIWAGLGLGFALSLVAGALVLSHDHRFYWPFHQPNTYGTAGLIMSAMLIPIGYPWSILAGFSVLGVIVSGSRGAYLAGLVVLMAVMLHVREYRRTVIILTICAVATAVVAYLSLFPEGRALDPAGRYYHWHYSLSAWELRPWDGWGLHALAPRWAHNSWVQTQADLGAIGLMTLEVAVFAAVVVNGTVAGTAAAAAVIIHSIVDFPLEVPGILALFWFALGCRNEEQ